MALNIEGLMIGWQLQILQNVCPSVYALKKQSKKAQSEKYQTSVMRNLYKSWLITKHKPELIDENTVMFDSWEKFTTC